MNKVLCEHDLYVDSDNHVTNGPKCGKPAACILCRSCDKHCFGHMQLRDSLEWRQFEFFDSHGRSE